VVIRHVLVLFGSRASQKDKLKHSKMFNAVLSRSAIKTFHTKKPEVRFLGVALATSARSLFCAAAKRQLAGHTPFSVVVDG